MLTKEKKQKIIHFTSRPRKSLWQNQSWILYKTMTKLGFSNKFMQFVKMLYKNNISYVTNNEYMSSPIQLLRGLRQEYPLYVIKGVVTTININKNDKVKGIKILNNKKETKISQYADDSNFLLSTQDSIQEVIHFFYKLKKATESTIDLEKTKVLPINTDQTFYIKQNITNITILKQHQYIKILGIQISENLKETIMLNWQNNLEKIENHIQKMSTRQISL